MLKFSNYNRQRISFKDVRQKRSSAQCVYQSIHQDEGASTMTIKMKTDKLKTDLMNTGPQINIIEISVSGKLCKEDYSQFVPKIEQLINEHQKVRILFNMHDFHGWNVAAAWEDLKFSWRHFNDIDRIAVISEENQESERSTFCAPCSSYKTKFFDRLNESAAWDWIAEPD